ncbi:hypothetical protein N9O36_01980 [Acidimicrobiia bacterium]|jgi:hypothetical protein|nr:hypothetical protein [Acidimicrobiia bacterium]|tara:strand:- start:1368 stop:1568 length:201 start_codon:yes stop_codon:yes gene_type:complete
MDGAELFKSINKLKKDLEEFVRGTEIKFIKKSEQYKKDIKEVSDKASRLEKLVLLLAVIQLVNIII